MVGALLLLGASPAGAAYQKIGSFNCAAEVANNSSHAWTYGDCSSPRARHQYMTSGNLHWTYWSSSVGGASPVASPLTKSEHGFTADGISRVVSIGA